MIGWLDGWLHPHSDISIDWPICWLILLNGCGIVGCVLVMGRRLVQLIDMLVCWLFDCGLFVVCVLCMGYQLNGWLNIG